MTATHRVETTQERNVCYGQKHEGMELSEPFDIRLGGKGFGVYLLGFCLA